MRFSILLLLAFPVFCVAETVVNDVVLSDEYVMSAGRMLKAISFGQAATFIDDELDFDPVSLATTAVLRNATIGEELNQGSFRDFFAPRELAVGESGYFAFATNADLGFVPVEHHWWSIGWMHLERTPDTGELLLLGSATNYGSYFDDTERRGPAEGITVGMVPEPSSSVHVSLSLLALSLLRRER